MFNVNSPIGNAALAPNADSVQQILGQAVLGDFSLA
jgi:hypothetical protein